LENIYEKLRVSKSVNSRTHKLKNSVHVASLTVITTPSVYYKQALVCCRKKVYSMYLNSRDLYGKRLLPVVLAGQVGTLEEHRQTMTACYLEDQRRLSSHDRLFVPIDGIHQRIIHRSSSHRLIFLLYKYWQQGIAIRKHDNRYSNLDGWTLQSVH